MAIIEHKTTRQSWYRRERNEDGTPLDHEVNDGPEIVETDTYVPFKEQIAQIEAAGEMRLQLLRDRFHYGEGEEVDPDIMIDPTQEPDYDPSQITEGILDAQNTQVENPVVAEETQDVGNPDSGVPDTGSQDAAPADGAAEK